VIARDLVRCLRAQFALDWNGMHGAPHWARVRANGLRLAPLTGAVPAVVIEWACRRSIRSTPRAPPD